MAAKMKLCAVLLSVALTGCVSTGGNRTGSTDEAVNSYLDLARGYVQEGYTEKAIKPLRRALELQPRSANVYGTLGVVYQLQGENQLAEEAFKKALSLDQDASDIQNNYGSFLFSQGRLSEAYKAFEKAAEDVSYGSRSRAYENMGVVAQRQGRMSQAGDHFEKSLKLNGNLPRARLELASILYEQGKAREAWRHYQVFTQLSQQNERSLMLGIRLARANGDTSAAANYSLQLERLYPGSSGASGYRSRSSYEY